jgi:hypothetical protein
MAMHGSTSHQDHAQARSDCAQVSFGQTAAQPEKMPLIRAVGRSPVGGIPWPGAMMSLKFAGIPKVRGDRTPETL